MKNPFQLWLETDEGQKCANFETLNAKKYLENRLYHAYTNGMLDEYKISKRLQNTIEWYEEQLQKLKAENQQLNHQLQKLQGQLSTTDSLS